MLRGQPGPALFKAFFLSEKWSHKHLSDSIFLTSLRPFPSSMAISHSLWLRLAVARSFAAKAQCGVEIRRTA
jgi:hypothetical protein